MTDSKRRTKAGFTPQIAGFVCNWGAYSAVEMAGLRGIEYPANMKLVRLTCLGRLHLGLVLRAFEMGADGVMLLGCPSQDCHYDAGMTHAKEVFAQAEQVLHLLGIDPERLAILELPLGGDELLARQVSRFVRRLGKAGSGQHHLLVKEPMV